MATMTQEIAGGVTKCMLSEAEVIALRDEAHEQMLNDAHEAIRFPDVHAERLLMAADVYGTLSGIRFHEVKGLQSPPEAAEVEFTERATIWLEKQREEFRGSLEDRRGSTEVNENTPGELMVLFVLDRIFGGEEVSA